MIDNFFETDVMKFQIGLALINELRNFIKTIDYENSEAYNLWDFKDPIINKIKDEHQEAVNIYSERIERYKEFYPRRAWINHSNRGNGNFIHYHGNVPIVSVLYLQVPAWGTGRLMLVDSRNGSFWPTDTQKGYEIKPISGQLILFPGHILHYVERNMNEIPRISLANNYGK